MRAALGALMGALSLDAYLIGRLVADSKPRSLAMAAGLLALFTLMWFASAAAP